MHWARCFCGVLGKLGLGGPVEGAKNTPSMLAPRPRPSHLTHTARYLLTTILFPHNKKREKKTQSTHPSPAGRPPAACTAWWGSSSR